MKFHEMNIILNFVINVVIFMKMPSLYYDSW